ncbi:putative glutathion S-transferase II, GST-II [Leptodontidium sp. MPI-SDFR-AT-0119]|nr:putative glutathion S-transferase II, GST-II [Leptodontidium sp. MPI-SDFR-AT-0119]
MVHIIGNNIATCTQRVLLRLAVLGVTDFTLYSPDVMAGEHKKLPHTAKHPFGLIPVLEDGDFTLYESRAICRYLATKYNGQSKDLIPDCKDLKATALFDQWASVELTDFDAFASELVAQNLFYKWRGLEAIPEVVDLVTKKLSDKLDIFDTLLAKQKYMGGNVFSLIDTFYMPYTEKLFEAGEGELTTSRPNVKAWWDRVTVRATWKLVNVKITG